jgi:small subunit ribosomal protein S16
LSRGGAKKRPYYKIVVADARTGRDGKFIERIGSYNPMLPKGSEERVKLDADRARHWLSVGAQPTDRVARFLDAAGVKSAPRATTRRRASPARSPRSVPKSVRPATPNWRPLLPKQPAALAPAAPVRVAAMPLRPAMPRMKASPPPLRPKARPTRLLRTEPRRQPNCLTGLLPSPRLPVPMASAARFA